MEKKYVDIINEAKKAGKTIEEVNKLLKVAGANFHLNPDGALVEGWTEAEMAEGFTLATDEAKDVVHLHDYMRYSNANAGKTIRVSVPEGTYDITWDEGGHPEKAVRV